MPASSLPLRIPPPQDEGWGGYPGDSRSHSARRLEYGPAAPPRHHPVPMGKLHRVGSRAHRCSQGPLEVPRHWLAFENQGLHFALICLKCLLLIYLLNCACGQEPREDPRWRALSLVVRTGKGREPRLAGGQRLPEVDEGPVEWATDGDRAQTKWQTAGNHGGSQAFPPSSSHLPVGSGDGLLPLSD